MRLAEALGQAPNAEPSQVENFLGVRKLAWGKLKTIQAGKVIRNSYCYCCHEVRTFLSGESLSCLVTGENSVSIDVALQCSACRAPLESWFLVQGKDDLYGPAPWIQLERFIEHKRPWLGPSSDDKLPSEHLDELLERARIAFEAHLGAGAMIYLRKIYEIVTFQAAEAAGIPTQGPGNRRKNFRRLLKEVDGATQIIPVEFTANQYRLFSELSELIHGESSESDALARFEPCRKLIIGLITNVRNKRLIADAQTSLGWASASSATPENHS